MKITELNHIIAAILVLTIVISFSAMIESNWAVIPKTLLFSALLIGVSVFSKKITARALDADAEHRIWEWNRYGFKQGYHLEKPIPAGIIFPLTITLITLGYFKLMTLLTYETSALKRRAAKRFGHYSFTEMTDWHNGLIGVAGIIGLFILAFISYFIPALEGLPRLAIFYAFFNILPVSNLDGTQIFFGSRILWTALAALTLILTAFAMVLV